jgi:hypothetical protein
VFAIYVSALANSSRTKIPGSQIMVRVEALRGPQSASLHKKTRGAGSWVWGSRPPGQPVRNRLESCPRSRLLQTQGMPTYPMSHLQLKVCPPTQCLVSDSRYAPYPMSRFRLKVCPPTWCLVYFRLKVCPPTRCLVCFRLKVCPPTRCLVSFRLKVCPPLSRLLTTQGMPTYSMSRLLPTRGMPT